MTKSNNKNGLIELVRFLCSIWVAYFHGFFPILSDKFSGGNISVDFFFMVSGLFFLKSIEKYREKPFLEGARFIFLGRTKRFIVPLIIAALSILYCNLAFPLEFNGFNWPFSFLWFFAAQFVYLSFFYFLLKKIKSRSAFNLACIIVICVLLIVARFVSSPINAPVRGPAMIAIGMLLSQIPTLSINLQDESRSRRLTLTLNAIGFALAAALMVFIAYVPGFAIGKIYIFCCIACPLLLYFASALPVRSKFLNFLGEVSVFIYLGQCPILLHHYYVSRDTREQFIPLCICAALLFVINRIINKKQLIK